MRVHRGSTVHGDVVREADGLALTTVTRTLIDLADQLTPHRLTRVCHRAEILRLLDARKIATRLDELPGRPAKALRAALETLAHQDPHHTRSELEERMLALIGQFELPEPKVNARVGRHVADFLWPNHRLIVETNGHAAHGTRTAFETSEAVARPQAETGGERTPSSSSSATAS